MVWWGRNPREVVKQWGVDRRVKELNEYGLKIGGFKARLWLEDKSGKRCSCKKQETESAEKICYSCYGVGHIAGYKEWGWDYVVFSSIDEDLIEVRFGVILDEGIFPHWWRLEEGVLEGEIVTKGFQVNCLYGGWESRVVSHKGVVDVYFSDDGGLSWKDLKDLSGSYQGELRFKVVIRRNSIDERSGGFEIFMLKYPRVREPWVLVSVSRSPYERKKDKYGEWEWEQVSRVWTSADIPVGVNSLIEIDGKRYPVYNPRRGITVDRHTVTMFDIRFAEPVREVYGKVF